MHKHKTRKSHWRLSKRPRRNTHLRKSLEFFTTQKDASVHSEDTDFTSQNINKLHLSQGHVCPTLSWIHSILQELGCTVPPGHKQQFLQKLNKEVFHSLLFFFRTHRQLELSSQITCQLWEVKTLLCRSHTGI